MPFQFDITKTYLSPIAKTPYGMSLLERSLINKPNKFRVQRIKTNDSKKDQLFHCNLKNLITSS